VIYQQAMRYPPDVDKAEVESLKEREERKNQANALIKQLEEEEEEDDEMFWDVLLWSESREHVICTLMVAHQLSSCFVDSH